MHLTLRNPCNCGVNHSLQFNNCVPVAVCTCYMHLTLQTSCNSYIGQTLAGNCGVLLCAHDMCTWPDPERACRHFYAQAEMQPKCWHALCGKMHSFYSPVIVLDSCLQGFVCVVLNLPSFSPLYTTVLALANILMPIFLAQAMNKTP
jgi:hypothetical protein